MERGERAKEIDRAQIPLLYVVANIVSHVCSPGKNSSICSIFFLLLLPKDPRGNIFEFALT